jgi:hypothetical protein
MEAGGEITCGFFVSGCDASEMLDDIEEPLDEVALAVEVMVIADTALSI